MGRCSLSLRERPPSANALCSSTSPPGGSHPQLARSLSCHSFAKLGRSKPLTTVFGRSATTATTLRVRASAPTTRDEPATRKEEDAASRYARTQGASSWGRDDVGSVGLNPLMRLWRMGTGWMGVIMDYEGVVVEDAERIHGEAWARLAREEGRPRPLAPVIKQASRMKAEQAISEVLCWGRESSHVRHLADRKDELFQEILGEWRPALLPGVEKLLRALQKQEVPIAICSTETTTMRDGLRQHGLEMYVTDVVAADDVYRCRPDPEAYAYAAQKINRPPVRCIVFGNCNQSVEAAHLCGMQSVAVAGQQPLYQFTTADLVVKQLDEISFVNLKQLFRAEDSVEPELEFEEQTEAMPQTTLQDDW